jgi:putative two-component system response regulator
MDTKKNSLLIVDDEIMVVRSLVRALDNGKYDFLFTADVKEALDILGSTPVDVIISDQRMPDMTGLELLMKAKALQPTAVRILMSGYSDIDIVIAAINEGRIYQYVAKPWDNDKLVETVAAAVLQKADEDEKAAILDYRLENVENWKTVISRLNSELEKKKSSTVNALIKVLKVKDNDLYKHSRSVAETSVLLAGLLGLSDDQKEALRYAGLFHDIGKIAIRDKIMYKPGALDENEFAVMKDHPAVGADILREADFPDAVARIVEQHHERADGGGYPRGYRSGNILPEAEIIAVADSFEALRESRVYKKGMSPEDALKILCGNDRHKYSAAVIGALEKAVAAGLTTAPEQIARKAVPADLPANRRRVYSNTLRRGKHKRQRRSIFGPAFG